MLRKTVKRFWWVPVLLAFGLATILYLHNIGTKGLWFDEAYSAALISVPPHEMVVLTATDVHPPLYYLLLKAWSMLFGMSEAALRSFSAVCMMGAMGVGFVLTRRYFGARASYAVLPFLVLAPFLLRYGQEARMYALATLICISATYALLRAQESTRKVWWILYALLIAAGLYTHYYTGLIWIAHWVWHGYMVRHTPGARFWDKSWLKAYGLAAVLFLLWAPVFIVQAYVVQGGFWIPPVTHHSLVNLVSSLFLYMQESRVTQWLSLGLIVIIGSLVALFSKTYSILEGAKKQYFVLMLLYSFLPVGLLFVLSLPPLQPVFVERYFVPATLGMYLLVGISVALGPRTKGWFIFKSLVVCIALAMLVFGVTNVYRVDGEQSQSRAKELTSQLQPRLGADDALVVASPYAFFEFNYYDTANKTFFIDPDHIVGVIGSVDVLVDSPFLIKDLSSFSAGKDKIWIVGPDDITFEVPDDWIEGEIIQNGRYKAISYE